MEYGKCFFKIRYTTWLHDKIVSFCYNMKRGEKNTEPIFTSVCPRFILRVLCVYMWLTNLFYSWF